MNYPNLPPTFMAFLSLMNKALPQHPREQERASEARLESRPKGINFKNFQIFKICDIVTNFKENFQLLVENFPSELVTKLVSLVQN